MPLKKLKTMFTHITVEPIYFAYAITFSMNHMASQELYIQKVCLVNMGYEEDVCDNLPYNTDEQNNVQQVTAKFQTARRLMGLFMSLAITFLAGPWSDRHGRKPIIILTIIGSVIESLVYNLNSIWFKQLKAEFVLFEVMGDCLGGLATITMATFAYIADVACEKDKTKRMAILMGVFQVGLIIGVTLGSTTAKMFGFVAAFSVSACVAAMGLSYSVFVLKESHAVSSGSTNVVDQANTSTSTSPKLYNLWKMPGFFHLKNVLEDFLKLKKNCHPDKRKLLAIVFFCFTMEGFVHIGELDFTYLYTRKKLNYSLLDFMIFTNMARLMSVLTQFVFVPILSKRFKLRDSTISVLDASTSVVQNIMVACATKSWMLYLSVVVAFLDSSSFSILKSIISKLVSPNEVGRGISLALIIGAAAKLSAVPIFGKIYWSTVAFFPQAIFFVMSGLYLMFALLMLYVDIKMKNGEHLKETNCERSGTSKKEGTFEEDIMLDNSDMQA